MTIETGSTRNHCIRCGECCLKSSPALHIQDLDLLNRHSIPGNRLYTIRKDELVRDPVNDKLVKSPTELIKFKELSNGQHGCSLFDKAKNACTIYNKRPSQCSALKCWDTDDFMAVFNSPTLERRDIIEDGVLLGLIMEHEKRCAYSLLTELIDQITDKGDKAVQKILEILRFDNQLRPFISKKLDLDPSYMDLYFGRPLTDTISMFGLKVEQESDGSFLLTRNS